MIDPYEFKKKSRKINEVNYEIKRKKRAVITEISRLNSWWEGKSSEAIKESLIKIDMNIGRLNKDLSNLQNKFNRLQKKIETAKLKEKR